MRQRSTAGPSERFNRQRRIASQRWPAISAHAHRRTEHGRLRVEEVAVEDLPVEDRRRRRRVVALVAVEEAPHRDRNKMIAGTPPRAATPARKQRGRVKLPRRALRSALECEGSGSGSEVGAVEPVRLADHVQRPRLDLLVDAADVEAQHPHQGQLDPAEERDDDEDRRPAGDDERAREFARRSRTRRRRTRARRRESRRSAPAEAGRSRS